MTPSKLKGFIWFLVVAFLATSLAVGLSGLIRLIPMSAEERLANSLVQFENRCETPTGQRSLDKIVLRLYPLNSVEAKLPLQVAVIAAPEVNAFASLAAQIFVTSGLIKEAVSADEIAAVLAHEIEHVKRRHVLEGIIIKLGTLGLFKALFHGQGFEALRVLGSLQYTKAQEREADEGGLDRLVKAQVNVQGFRDFFARQSEKSVSAAFFSDHPSDQSRMARAQSYLGRPSRPLLDATEWQSLKTICVF